MGITKLDWQHFQDLGKSIPVDKIIKEVNNTLINKDSFTASIKKYREKFTEGADGAKIEGSQNAAKIIERMLN